MMITKIKIALVLCLSLMLWVGSAAADSADDSITEELFPGVDVGETDDIPPFQGAVGPAHALYGLRIAFGNIDEAFTYNASERLCKQVSAARHRMAEARAELDRGNEEAAGLALGHYKNKTDEIDTTLDGSDINAKSLTHARQMMLKHNQTLQNIIQQNNSEGKNMIGLENALRNCFRLEEKFNYHIENKVNNMAGQTHGKGPKVEVEVEVSDGSLDEKKANDNSNGNSNGKGNHKT